jgi:hypothetical protein
MHTNVQSFSLYWPLLCSVFTYILLLFPTAAFSLYKKLLWFVRNVPDNFDKNCAVFSYKPYGSDFMAFFHWHFKSRKQQFGPS